MILCRRRAHPCSPCARLNILLLIQGHRQSSKSVLEGEAAGLGQVDWPYGPQGELHLMPQSSSRPVLVSWTPVRICYLYSFEWDQHTSSAFINTTSRVPRSGPGPGPTTHQQITSVCHTQAHLELVKCPLIHTHQVHTIFFSILRRHLLERISLWNWRNNECGPRQPLAFP